MKKSVLFIVAIALLITGAVNAQPDNCFGPRDDCRFGKGMRHDGPGPGRHMDMEGHRGFGAQGILTFADEIGLTDDQISEIKEMTVAFKLKQVDARAEMQKEQIKLRTMMRDENSDENTVNAAIDKVAQLNAQLKKMRYNHSQKVRNILTDEQKEKLKNLRMERRDDFERDFKGGFGRKGR